MIFVRVGNVFSAAMKGKGVRYLAAGSLMLGIGCSPADILHDFQNPRLAQLARQARSAGKDSITTGFIPEKDTYSTLRDVFQNSAILVARPEGAPRVGIDGDQIFTAQDFRVDRWVHRPSTATNCGASWPGVSDDQSLVTLRMYKGTILFRGVNITEMTTAEIEFNSGKPYLLLVRECPGRRIELGYWFNSVFHLTETGEISAPTYNRSTVPFVNEILNLKTIAELERSR